MKKQNIILLIFSILYINNCIAQDVVLPERPKLRFSHEIGFNGLPILKQVFNFSSNNQASESPYWVIYKLGLGKNFIRTSIGGVYSNKKEQVDGFLDSKSTILTQLNGRFGFERQHQTKHFRFSYGLDGVFEAKDNTTIIDSGFDQVYNIEQETSYGGGPFMGLAWNLTSNLSLYSEVGAYFSLGNGSKQVDFVKNPDFNDIENAFTTKKMSYLTPTAIYLLYKF